MKYYKHLYMDEKTTKKREKIISRIEKKKFQPMIYVIYVPEKSESQLEIVHSSFLLQKSYSIEPSVIAGLASGYEEALQIVEQITREAYRDTGKADIKEYLLNKEQGEGNVKHSSFNP